MKEIVYVLGAVAGLAFAIGLLFKIYHWPGADVMLAVFTVSAVVFIPLFVIYQYRKDID
mgnify:CR=1 FL=1